VSLEGIGRHAQDAVPGLLRRDEHERLAVAGLHRNTRRGSLAEGEVGAQLVEEALRREKVLLGELEDLHVVLPELRHPVRVHPEGRVAGRGRYRVKGDVVADVEVQLGDLPDVLLLVDLEGARVDQDAFPPLEEAPGAPEGLEDPHRRLAAGGRVVPEPIEAPGSPQPGVGRLAAVEELRRPAQGRLQGLEPDRDLRLGRAEPEAARRLVQLHRDLVRLERLPDRFGAERLGLLGGDDVDLLHGHGAGAPFCDSDALEPTTAPGTAAGQGGLLVSSRVDSPPAACDHPDGTCRPTKPRCSPGAR
jgi:hypothetical protein